MCWRLAMATETARSAHRGRPRSEASRQAVPDACAELLLADGFDTSTIEAALDTVCTAGREFGLPVGANKFFTVDEDYRNGARAWFTVGPASAAGFPVTPEQRKAVGR